jgi:hypothetical protein
MHVPVLRQTGACCHGEAAFDKPASHLCDPSVATSRSQRRNFAIAGVAILRSRRRYLAIAIDVSVCG